MKNLTQYIFEHNSYFGVNKKICKELNKNFNKETAYDLLKKLFAFNFSEEMEISEDHICIIKTGYVTGYFSSSSSDPDSTDFYIEDLIEKFGLIKVKINNKEYDFTKIKTNKEFLKEYIKNNGGEDKFKDEYDEIAYSKIQNEIFKLGSEKKKVEWYFDFDNIIETVKKKYKNNWNKYFDDNNDVIGYTQDVY